MPRPIPVHTKSLVIELAGTAFIATDDSSTWLVTCVHGFSGLKDTPAEARYFQQSQIRVLDGGPTIPLYDDGEKRFVVLTENDSNILWDIIAVRLSSGEAGQLHQYGAYLLDEIVAPEVGDIVQIAGFPGLGTALAPATVMAAKIVDVQGASIEFDQPSVPGWSGSPVEKDDFLIGMIHGDRGPPSNPTAGLAINLAFFKDHLFV